MNNNLCLITSVINTPDSPLSYTNVRSIFSSEQRFQQTIQTIHSVKEKIPNTKIFIIECSELKEDIENYLMCNSDYYLNLHHNKELRKDIFGISKSLGEGTQTIEALKYIINNDLIFDNLFKISGRYYLSDTFDYNKFNNNNIIVKKINNNIDNIFTALYKINIKDISLLKNYLEQNIVKMKNCFAYESLFGNFLKEINYNNVIFIDNIIGLNGYVSVCGSKFIG
jgi:hypothetical protein